MEPFLEALNVTKRFGHLVAVQDISLAVPPGVALGLVGPNGSGKTTLMKCCAGLLRPEGGTVRVAGHDLTAGDPEAKRALAFAPELPDPVGLLTAWDHLAFIGNALELDRWEAEATRLLTVFDMMAKRNRIALSLSKGERQKVMLSMAFLRRPKLLLLDEPLIGLDPRATFALKNEVRALVGAGSSAVISSHVLSLVEELCPMLAVMSRGRLSFIGSPDGLRVAAAREPGANLEEAFIVITEPGEGDIE